MVNINPGLKSLITGNRQNGENGRNAASGSSQETPNNAHAEKQTPVANERLTRRSRIPDVVPLPLTPGLNGAEVPVVPIVPKKEPDWEPENEERSTTQEPIIQRDPRMGRVIENGPPEPQAEPQAEPQPVEIPFAGLSKIKYD